MSALTNGSNISAWSEEIWSCLNYWPNLHVLLHVLHAFISIVYYVQAYALRNLFVWPTSRGSIKFWSGQGISGTSGLEGGGVAQIDVNRPKNIKRNAESFTSWHHLGFAALGIKKNFFMPKCQNSAWKRKPRAYLWHIYYSPLCISISIDWLRMKI